MWRDSVGKRRARYRYILKDAEIFSDAAGSVCEGQADRSLSKNEQVLCDVTTLVLAPALNSYVMWVLKAALKRKIRRLYFLARDGYFMYTTAKKYCERLHLPIDCRYLSCSRYSVRIPMFYFNEAEAFDYICRGGIDVTMDKVLNRAGLTDEEKALVKRELGGEFCEGIIAYADLEKVKKRLEICEPFLGYMRAHSKAAFPTAAAYFRQEGLFDDISYAFADSGWVGSMQKVLGQLIAKCDKSRKMSGFYWGLYELPADADPEDYTCFYFSPVSGLRRKISFSNCLFESIFSAPHGMTLGYEKREDSKVYPIYADIRESNRLFNEKTGDYIGEFTDKVLERLRIIKKSTGKNNAALLSHPGYLDVTTRLLDAFMGQPARHEAFYFGRLPFSDDVLDENEQSVAAPLDEKELASNHPLKKILILTGISKNKIRESAWYEGSAVRNGKNTDSHLRAYALYKYMLYAKKEALRIKKRLGRG